MENGPHDPSEDPGKNPFEGTPFEQLFGALGEGGLPDLSGVDLPMIMSQLQAMMQPSEGPVNWTLATDIARRVVAATPDPTPTESTRHRVADAVRLADHWLDDTTLFPAGATDAVAWSRAEWVEGTIPVWKGLVEPVAEQVVDAMGEAIPEEARAMAGPFIGMIGQLGGTMFGAQVGHALGTLAGDVLTASDIGLPLGPPRRAVLVTDNIASFADGLGVSLDDVMLYLALREAAHHRLFTHVPWLTEHLLRSVATIGEGVSIDLSAIEDQITQNMAGLDPTDPEAINRALTQGLFQPEKTPQQRAALERLETLLALVEGWVDDVVGQAAEDRMPTAAKLREAIRRRRAAGGPAEETFAALVGLELRPRRLRDAATLWGSLRSRQGHEGRDAVWAHPDLLPRPADLDDPLAFRDDLGEPLGLSDEEFDSALAALLDARPNGDGDGDGDGDGGRGESGTDDTPER